MHATDWLPTLLSVVSDGKWVAPPHLAKVLDGFDVWPALTNVSNLNTSSVDPRVSYSPRYEIPHNVDPLQRVARTGEPVGARYSSLEPAAYNWWLCPRGRYSNTCAATGKTPTFSTRSRTVTVY